MTYSFICDFPNKLSKLRCCNVVVLKQMVELRLSKEFVSSLWKVAAPPKGGVLQNGGSGAMISSSVQ